MFGGIDPRWRAFGSRLQALGIDASVNECRRLAELETNPNVSYVAAFASRSADKPIDLSGGSASSYMMRLFDRLSVKSMLDVRKARLEASAAEEKMQHNAWAMTNLADPGNPIVASELLADRCWASLDYLKIDVDGVDFDILRSFDGHLDRLGVTAVQLEVNFCGTGGSEEHSFHNTDRFLRQRGYELFRLENRTYSARALPARFALAFPAQTVSGRVFQGEAYYALDPVASNDRALTDTQLIKLVAIFSAWNLPDCAAEILLTFRARLENSIDIDRALDVLAAQTQDGDEAETLPYQAYMAEFFREAPRFFPPPPRPSAIGPVGPPTFWQRIRAARSAYWDWVYASDVEAARTERKTSRR